MTRRDALLVWFDAINNHDVPTVGGKNASLGEMIRELGAAGIRVPGGFALTSRAYRSLLEHNGLAPLIQQALDRYHRGEQSLTAAGRAIRGLFLAAELPAELKREITAAYAELCRRRGASVSVAVRSSATAEDLPTASFAGQQETFLNIVGDAELLAACTRCYASLFTDRAIAYRESKGFEHSKVALSIGVQEMVRSDKGSAGVMFTIDTETGFPNVVLINAAYGLGENVVKGAIDPDEIWIFKPALADATQRPILRKKIGSKAHTMVFAGGASTTKNIDTPDAARAALALNDDDALALARWAVQIEDHYSKRAGKKTPMDIEWAKDGLTGELFIVQARPETVQSQAVAGSVTRFTLQDSGNVLARGRSVGDAIAAGRARVLSRPDEPFEPGSVLVTEMTDPDWLPLMRKAAAVVTNHGGRTCHAAILSRELGIPAIVGTGNGTQVLAGEITVSCAEGDEGRVYAGRLRFEKRAVTIGTAAKTRTKIMMNLADPGSAFRHWRLPTDGIGLARMEFIIANEIGVHPMALLHPERVTDAETRAKLEALGGGRFFVERLAQGVATLAASQYPKPVIVRMSDFKTNEYANLLGGRDFESAEENPMIGFRGASRYYHPRYKEAFLLECAAMKMAREELGLGNIALMIPFCRTLAEADKVLSVMAEAGLARGKHELKVLVMCEIPSNVILAEKFAKRFDGFSIGSNDLTQLTLGIDRDSELLAESFDEKNEAVTTLILEVIERAHAAGVTVGLCGQAPSDDPAFAEMLVEYGIDSISLNPDSVIAVRERVRAAEERLSPGGASPFG
ncbi:MAG: phosphoenolpyruvate synthase [Deltaproteobacteria bacterium]|nr:phosphoenolpyruvate synthase [Deltaproteobacteria bacterium]